MNAQNNFFKTFKHPSNERAFSSVQLSDGDFIIAGEKSETGYYGNTAGYLARLSVSGEILKEVEINPNTSARLCIVIPYPTEHGDLLCIGSADSTANNESYSRRIFYRIDTGLNIKSNRFFTYKCNYTQFPWQYTLRNDSILYLMSDYSIKNLNGNTSSFIDIVKYRLPFDSLNSYVDTNLSVTQDIYFNNATNNLNVYIFPQHRKLKFDENLNYILSSVYPQQFPSNICISGIYDTNYLLSGSAYNTASPNLQIGAIKYSNYDNAIDSIYYTPSIDTNYYVGGRESACINGNNIFLSGIYNVHAWPFPYNYNSSWVTISKLDMDLNMISTHFYGGDAQYCPFSIIPTSDGGCFITGYSYDYINNLPNNNYELDIFVLKTDADGLITELPDQPQAKAHDAIVFPNPGYEYLNIQSGPQITGAEFYLFDMQGKPVVNEKINNTQLKVNTTNLVPGTYPWQIVFKNKVIESGKWVKK